ncbi:hypothetical protein EDB80DRAFT_595851 [Ilyonectria destructans]|nr:hypothetical protein EDB80DRAFT_595851 [Ilyonectria destructans]
MIPDFLAEVTSQKSSEDALRKLPRKLAIFDHDAAKVCAICIDDMEAREKIIVLPCQHQFHEACGVRWLAGRYTCPVCRKPITEESQSNG